MSRICILGYAPLPVEPMKRAYSGTFRTWNMIQYALSEGHEVLAFGMRLTGAFSPEEEKLALYEESNLTYYSVDELTYFQDLTFLRSKIEEYQPDAIIGVNTYPAHQAVSLDLDLPVWADLNGYVMSEAQSKATLMKDDHWLTHYWHMEKPILEKADFFSTASEKQRYALLGELASVGRLNSKAQWHKDIVCFPNQIDKKYIDQLMKHPDASEIPELYTKLTGTKFLWAGSFTTWTDAKTLAQGFANALKKEEMHLIVTGGKVDGHDEVSIVQFQELCQELQIEDHVHFTGWLEINDLTPYMVHSDFGLCIDKPCLETEIGARYRITNMLAFGLPVITTLGTEISHFIEEQRLGFTSKLESAESLSETLEKASKLQDAWKNKHQDIQLIADRFFGYKQVLSPLGEWMKSPQNATDKEGFRFPATFEKDLKMLPAKTILRLLWDKVKKRIPGQK